MSADIATNSQVPSFKDIKTWLSKFFKTRKHHWDVRDFVKPDTIDWFITTQRNEWIESGRAFTSMEELIFGVPNPTGIKMISLGYGLHYYSHSYISDSPSYVDSPWQLYRNEQNVPADLTAAIREEYPGMPQHFVNVSVAFLYKSVPANVTGFIPISRQAIITFLMICSRMNLPTEMIHLILLNLKIDTYQDTLGQAKFLDTGMDFKKAIETAGDMSRDLRVSTKYYNITQVIKAFGKNDY
jgi:hypothetical protein